MAPPTKTKLTGKITPSGKRKKGSKAAIIRPVNRGDGKTSFVRIDSSQDGPAPNIRAVQLDDYVSQIREHETPAIASVKSKTSGKSEAKIVRDTARRQLNSSAELTEADHLSVLRAVSKIDAGYHWIDDQNRAAAEAAAAAKKAEAEAEVVEVKEEEISQELINDIAVAIASVLTRRSEAELAEKVPSEEEEEEVVVPEAPQPTYPTMTGPGFAVKEAPAFVEQLPPASHTISLSAAAWDVPAFRWTRVSDHILSAKSMLGGLADNCQSMLSPFGKTIAVTSPTRGQGTTTMSMTLARLFASSGKRVLLVDADIMQPHLSKTIGINGVSWYRNSDSAEPIAECIVHGRNSGVCVMPLDAPITNLKPNNVPVFDRLEAHIDRVRGEFDLIVIDAGPVWQIVDEIGSESHLIDAAMLVNQDMKSNGFAEARQRLMECGVFRFIAAQNSIGRRAG